MSNLQDSVSYISDDTATLRGWGRTFFSTSVPISERNILLCASFVKYRNPQKTVHFRKGFDPQAFNLKCDPAHNPVLSTANVFFTSVPPSERNIKFRRLYFVFGPHLFHVPSAVS